MYAMYYGTSAPIILTITQSRGVLLEFRYATCPSTTYFTIFVALTAAYKLGMHIVAMVFAIASRKIKVDALNDYKYTSVIIYTSTVLIILLLVVIFASRVLLTLVGVVSVLIFSESMVFVSLTYIPKVSSRSASNVLLSLSYHLQMVALYKDPKGEFVFADKETRSTRSIRAASVSSERHLTVGTLSNRASPANVLEKS